MIGNPTERAEQLLAMGIVKARKYAQLLTKEEVQSFLALKNDKSFNEAYQAKLKHDSYYNNMAHAFKFMFDNTYEEMAKVGLTKDIIWRAGRLHKKYSNLDCNDLPRMNKEMLAAYIGKGNKSDKIPRQKAVVHGLMKKNLPTYCGIEWLDSRIDDVKAIKLEAFKKDMLGKRYFRCTENAHLPFCYGVDNL